MFSPADYYRVTKTKIHKEKLFYDPNAFIQSSVGREGACMCIRVHVYFLANYVIKQFSHKFNSLLYLWTYLSGTCLYKTQVEMESKSVYGITLILICELLP